MGIRRVGWKEARERVRKAAKENPSVSYLQAMVDEKDGFCQMWAHENCVFVTRVDRNKDGRRLVVCLLAGDDMFKWGGEIEETLNSLAKAHNCTKIAVEGRRGWEKVMKPMGFRFEAVTLVKDLREIYRFTVKTITEYSKMPDWRRHEQ